MPRLNSLCSISCFSVIRQTLSSRLHSTTLGTGHLSQWIATSAPPAAATQAVYAETAQAITTLTDPFSWEYLLMAKWRTLYWDALELLLLPPIGCQNPAQDGTKNDVFHRIRRLPVPTATKDMFVCFHAGVLSLKIQQTARGFFVSWSVNCRLCQTAETAEHVFLTCINASLFWYEIRTIQPIDKGLLPCP